MADGPASLVAPEADRKKRRQRLIVLGGAAALLFLAGAVGSGLYIIQRNDPVHRATELIAKGDLRAAQVELRNAMRANPRDADLHMRLAELQMKLADSASADRELKTALALGADRWVVAPLLADALLAQGLNEETLRRTPSTGPTPESAAKNLYMRSVAQLALNDLKGADATLAAAQKAAPDSVEAALIAARVAAAREDYRQTEAKVDAVLRRDPAQIDALLMKQQIVADRGDHAAALDLAARAVASSPWSAMARIRHATELMYAGRDEQAKIDIDAVLAVQPRFIEAVYLDGILMARQGRYQDAAVQLEKLDGVLGRFPQALYYKALIAANLNQTETAVSFARRYNVLVPSDLDGVRLMARADIAAGASEHAVPFLQQVIAGGVKDAAVFDLLGSAQGNLGNTPEAIAAFKQALVLSPNDAGFMTHLGLAQIQSGASADAANTLMRTAENPAAPVSAGEALVSAAIGDGDLVKAQAALDALKAKAGDSQQVAILAGMIEVRRLNLDAARTRFADAVRRFPASLSAKFDYARVLLMQGRRLDAMAMMAEVLAKDPANIPTLNAYVPLLLQNRQLDQVVAVLDAAHTASPRVAGFTASLADALVMSGDATRAVTVLQGVREAGALPPLLLAAFARAQAAAGLTDDAKANFRDVLRLQPDDIADRTALIDMLLRAKEYDAARTELQDAVARFPRNYRFMSTLVELEAQTKGIEAGLTLAGTLRADAVHMPFSTLLKGDALMRARRYNAAIRAFQEEYAIEPAVPPLMRQAAAMVAAGQEGEASALLQGWLAKQPNTPAVLEELAKLDLRAGRLEQAQAHLEALLGMIPDNAEGLNNLAYTYQRRGDPRARPTAQRAYLQDGGPGSADTLGWIIAEGGDTAAALPLLQQAVAQAPGEPTIGYHLAATLKAAGRPADAAQVLKGVLAKPTDFPERVAAQTMLAELSK